MDGILNFDGKKYISAKFAAKNFGYTSDYIGQLCRAKKINSRLVGRSWYVLELDLIKHKNFLHKDILTKKPTPAKKEKIRLNKKTRGMVGIKINKSENLVLASNSVSDDYNLLAQDERNEQKEAKNDKSRIAELGSEKILYFKDNKELFPDIVKKFDIETARYVAIISVEKAIKKPQRKSSFEKFASRATIAAIILSFFGTLVFEQENIAKLASVGFGESVKEELYFLYGPYLNNFQKSETYLNSGQIASVFSAEGWKSVSGWAKDIANKILKPWRSKDGGTIIVEDRNKASSSDDNSSQPSLTTREGVGTNISQAKTIFVPSSDKEYVDFKIAELKNWFLISPLAPNVNRYYISRQNDVIVSKVSGSSSSGGGTSNVANLSDLSDLTLTSLTYGDLLMYDGSAWINMATSSLGISGSGDILSIGDVGSGAAFDGTQGTTLTFNNALGDATLSYDGNAFSFSKLISFPYSSSTIYSSFATASTTNLIVNGQSFNNLLGNGLQLTGGALTANCVAITGSADLCDGSDRRLLSHSLSTPAIIPLLPLSA